jgi:hypothetical protein
LLACGSFAGAIGAESHALQHEVDLLGGCRFRIGLLEAARKRAEIYGMELPILEKMYGEAVQSAKRAVAQEAQQNAPADGELRLTGRVKQSQLDVASKTGQAYSDRRVES